MSTHMDDHSRLYEEIRSLTSLIYLDSKRSGNSTKYRHTPPVADGKVHSNSASPDVCVIEDDDDGIEPLDETESEERFSTDNATVALTALKRQALDRLAEKKRVEGANLDAKHVTSVVMVEDKKEDNKEERLVILCSKNEGLDKVDEAFLRELGRLLQEASSLRAIQDSVLDSVFDLILDHNTHRSDYHLQVLRDTFHQASQLITPDNLTADVSQDEYRQWEGISIHLPSGRQNAFNPSAEVSECLSDQTNEIALAETFLELQDRLRGSDQDNYRTGMKRTLNRVYAIIRHAKQRPALKNFIWQALGCQQKLFRKAWSTLLFMTRTSHAHFGRRSWRDTDMIKSYRQRLRQKRTVHAEIQLVYYLEMRPHDAPGLTGDAFPYVGCSKKCCFFCEEFLQNYGKLSQRGTHEAVFPQWALPPVTQRPSTNDLKWLTTLLVDFSASLKGKLCSGIGSAYRNPKRDQLRQSSAALSTAQVVEQEKPSFTARPSIITDGRKFTHREREVLSLFVTIQPFIQRSPDIYSSTWTKSGFCYCKTFQQRKELSAKYLALAGNATFDEIVSAYETSTVPALMTARGIAISNLTRHGVPLTRPPVSQYAVFRLMIAVEHALSGRYCNCFRMRQDRACYCYFETHLDIECDVGYGFHLTNSWERWQLLNYYQYVFKLPAFDVRTMATAKETREKGSLERHLDTLVPDMRRKVFDMDRAGSIFFSCSGWLHQY
ncbi:hypothetical protein BDW59DRAFT_170460 [Aspergillus cavernicola]|uniref:Uncharacterized protein n=1 Tax=Aspergillus cavernicola TaxID=176166 RepID=A0ABR4INS6_9EURO